MESRGIHACIKDDEDEKSKVEQTLNRPKSSYNTEVEKHLITKPGYKEYKDRTSVLFPWFQKKKGDTQGVIKH